MAVPPNVYNPIRKQPVKKAPVKKAPAVGAADPYGAAPMIGGLTMTQIQGMTPQQIALWGAYQQSQGPDYSKLPTVNFSKLHQAAVAEAGKETASLVQPYQAEQARLKQNFQVSSQAAANFAAAFSAIAGGGNANIDDPAAQAYALKNFGGSYVGGMAATIGAQLLNQQGAYWTAEDAKNAAQIKQITDASPDLAEKIYKSAVDDAVTQIKLGKSIADMSFKNKLGAIAALGKAMGGTGQAKGSWQTINGHRVWTVNGQIVNDAGYAGTGGGSGGSGSSASTKTTTYNGKKWQWNPATGKYDIPLGTTGTSSSSGAPGGGTTSNGKPVSPGTFGSAVKRAEGAGANALSGVYDRIWAKGFVAAGRPDPTIKDKNGNDVPNPVYEGVLRWAAAQKQRSFGTAMYKVISEISPYLKAIGYTPDQVKAEAYRIVTQVGDPTHHQTITAPRGYKVPKAKNVSFTSSTASNAAIGATQVAATQLGKPYVWGTESPGKSFDCSGLVQYAYAQMGVKIPRTTYDQIKAGVPVKYRSTADLLPGDLIFPERGHVVMYVGDGKVIAAPHTGTTVQYQDVGMFVPPLAVRRIVAGGTGGTV